MLVVAVWAWACAMGVGWAAGECVAVEGVEEAVKGDAAITMLLPLHHGALCDQLDFTSVQIMEATKLAVEKVNHLSLVPEIRLGLRVADTCSLEGLSVKAAVRAWAVDAFACPEPVLTLGYLGPGDLHSASAVSKATQTLGTPVVSYGPRPAAAEGLIDLISPAPQRSAQAAVHVLNGAGVAAVSVVHTADLEGRTLSEHFVTAAEYMYICVETVLEAGDGVRLAGKLRGGPGALVILGTRHEVQRLAQALSQIGDLADLIILVETGGPVPQVELAGLETPTLILQRMAPILSEFQLFLERDMNEADSLRRRYLAAVSGCEACSGYFGYDAAAPAAIAAVLMYVEALRKAKTTHCDEQSGLCPALRSLEASAWRELLTTVSLQEVARMAFPELVEEGLDAGTEDVPRYRVKLLLDGNLTQVGQADESSAVLGLLEPLETRCGTRCPCHHATQDPPSSKGGINIMGGAELWNWVMPDPAKLTRWKLAVYAMACTFFVMIFLLSTLICIFNVIKTPSRD